MTMPRKKVKILATVESNDTDVIERRFLTLYILQTMKERLNLRTERSSILHD
jgi:hypothetical protein